MKGLGDVEVETLSEGVSYETTHGGVTLSTRREERPLVLPSEVSRLENLSGYLKFPGPSPVARIRLKYRKRDIVAARFVPRQDDSHDPSLAGGPPARLTDLAGSGAVPASDARNGQEGLTPESTAADGAGNAVASSPDESTGKAATGTPAQEEETQPPWVKF